MASRSPVDMVDEIFCHQDRLTVWEVDFLESIDAENLSDAQYDKLAQIHRRYCKE